MKSLYEFFIDNVYCTVKMQNKTIFTKHKHKKILRIKLQNDFLPLKYYKVLSNGLIVPLTVSKNEMGTVSAT